MQLFLFFKKRRRKKERQTERKKERKSNSNVKKACPSVSDYLHFSCIAASSPSTALCQSDLLAMYFTRVQKYSSDIHADTAAARHVPIYYELSQVSHS